MLKDGVEDATGAGLLERDDERRRIGRVLDAASAGEGGVVVVTGAAGMGKTKLLEAAVADAASVGARVLVARAGELERGFAFGVVRQLVEAPVLAADDARRAELLSGAAARAAAALDLDPGSARTQDVQVTLHGLYWLLANLAAACPLVVAVDDIQWADDASVRWLAYVVRAGSAATKTPAHDHTQGSSGPSPNRPDRPGRRRPLCATATARSRSSRYSHWRHPRARWEARTMRTSQRRLTRALAVAVATDEFPRSGGVYGGKTLAPRTNGAAGQVHQSDAYIDTTEGAAMSRARVHNFSISLDGFATGEGQAADAPFGHAGHRLHEWMLATRFWELLGLLATDAAGTVGVDNAFAERNEHGIGAEIMGAGKFGPPGWQDAPEWRGWWGDNPPFHTPTYVLTHHPRPPLEMEGGTTFHFLDAAPADALDAAREAAAGQDVRIGGGPTMLREFLAAGLVDHLHVVQVPILLGRGVRLWDGLEALEQQYEVEAVSTPSGVTHLTFTR